MREKLLLILVVCACMLQAATAQQKTIQGKVTDALGNALNGVTVRIKNAKAGTSTDAKGVFTLAVNNNATLLISSVGFETKQVSVGNNTMLEVQLMATSSALDEVVVTALGVKREKRNLTYSTQEVKGEDLVKSKESNVVNALAGKVSGVQITSSSGTPGSSSRIVIRGATSIFGENQALIVVDGVPINNDETGNLDAGPGSNRLTDIDPATIETINVLKGAAATALYGSSGARGVVMITTKSGGADKKPVLTFSTDLSNEHPLLPKIQNKYGQGTLGVFYNGEDQKTSAVWGPLMDTLKINGLPAKKYDQSKLFFRTGVTSNSSLSVSGGGPSSSYFMSYSYFDQKGIVPTTEYKRNALFVKFGNRITKNLNSTIQINYSNSNNDRAPEGYVLENPIWTIFTAPVSWNPLPYLNADGTQRVYRFSRNNPYWVLDNVHNKSVVNRFIPVATFNYTPLSWLTVTERIGADIYGEQDKFKEAPSSTLQTTGRIIEQNGNFRQYNHDLIVNANKQFGKFNVNLLLGNNLLSTYYQYYRGQGLGITIDNFDNVSNSSSISFSESHYQQRKVGFYAQANIDYNRFLNLSLTGRYDGSSVLAKDKSFYPYGSAAAGFVFSELLPANVRKTINLAKLRVSYATVGNDGVGPYSLATPFVVSGIGSITSPFQGQSLFLQSGNLGNPLLKNERLNEYEIGFEGKFFKVLNVEVSYFDKQTVDGIIPGITIAPSTGYLSTTVNSAKLENKGIEVLLNATPVRSGKFSWDVSVNFTRIRNKVIEINDKLGITQLGNGFTQVIKGQPYGVKFGGRYKRSDNGQLMIDAAGLPYRDDNDGIIGNITPNWLAGISNTFKYGPLSLSFFFDMKKGGDIENNVDGYGYFYGTPKVTENRGLRIVPGISEVDNKPNTVAVSGQDYYRRLNSITEAVIQDGTYLKLRNVSISYEFTKNTLAKTPFKAASLSVTGRNLWIYSPHFTGGDPEVSSFGSSNGSQGIYSFSTPTSRSVDVALRVSF